MTPILYRVLSSINQMPPVFRLQIVAPPEWEQILDELVRRSAAVGITTSKSEIARELITASLPAYVERLTKLEQLLPKAPRVVLGPRGPTTSGPGRELKRPTRATKTKKKT